MRKLLALLIVLALLAGALSIVDIVTRAHVETAIAHRIEARSPGSHAVVTISAFPMLGYVAANGTLPSVRADITGVTSGRLRFERIDLRLDGLEVSRAKLLHGDVQAVSIRRGQVSAEISQTALDAYSDVPVILGRGTVALAGVAVSAHLTIVPGAVVIALAGGLMSIRVPVPELDVLPCVGAGQVLPGAIELSCSFRSLPGLLAGRTFHVFG